MPERWCSTLNTDIQRIIVHDGTFHADDVLCVVMLRSLFPHALIERMSLSHLPPQIPLGTIVADIGFGQYDHHQPDAKLRPDGRKYAACGLILESFRPFLFPNTIPKELLDCIRQVEDYDNKYSDAMENFLCEFVRLRNPEWDEANTSRYIDVAFFSTVEDVSEHFFKPYLVSTHLPTEEATFFTDTIKRLREKHSEAEARAETQLMEAYAHSNRTVVILHDRFPWYSFLIPRPTLFVITPSNRGGYHLQSIPVAFGSNVFKKYLPETWLQTPPAGCTFVHNKLFLAAFSSLEYAKAAAYSLSF